MTADEVLEKMEGMDIAVTDEDCCLIDAATREIFIPQSLEILGVESDEASQRVRFKCPRIVGDKIDLTAMHLYVNYRNANGAISSYVVDDVENNGENVTFSWLVSRFAAMYKGDVQFIVCARKSNEEGEIINEWNTTLAKVTVLEGIEADTPDIDSTVTDTIESLLNMVKKRSEEAVEAVAAAGESVKNSLPADYTALSENVSAMRQGKIDKQQGIGNAGKVLTVGVDGVVAPGDRSSGAGLNDVAAALLIDILRNSVYSTDQSSNITDLEVALSGNIYRIINNLTKCTIDNAAVTIKEYQTYTATITADISCEINFVSITMGGVDITAAVYNNGAINIGSVTGDIVITCTAAKVNDNLIKLSECTNGGNMPDGGQVTPGTYLATPYLTVQAYTAYKHNITLLNPDGSTTGNQKMYMFDSNKTYTGVKQINGSGAVGSMSMVETNSDTKFVRIYFSAKNPNPYFGLSGEVE